ncbi:MAG: hypothetical protein AB8G86_30020 [Saprospiraceae bacterium]
MKLFTNHKIIKTDLGKFTLADALEKLKQEDFFKHNTSFHLIRKVSEQHVIFGIPRNRATAKQIHEFVYKPMEKVIEVSSKYESIFSPNYWLLLLPIQVMYLGGIELVQREWITFFFTIVGITIFIVWTAFTSIKYDSAIIERALAIRLNYLARKK